MSLFAQDYRMRKKDFIQFNVVLLVLVNLVVKILISIKVSQEARICLT